MLAHRSLGASVCLRCRLSQARLRLSRAPPLPLSAAATTTATFTTYTRRLHPDQPSDDPSVAESGNAEVQSQPLPIRRVEGGDRLLRGERVIDFRPRAVTRGRKGKRVKETSEPLKRLYLGETSEVLILRDVLTPPEVREDLDDGPTDHESEVAQAQRRREIRAALEASIAGQNSFPGQEDVNEQIIKLRPVSIEGRYYTPFVTREELKELRKALKDGYNVGQLRRYAETAESQKRLKQLTKEERAKSRLLWKSAWKEGTTPISQRLPEAETTEAPVHTLPKMKVVDRIVQGIWGVGVIEESEAVGEIELKLEKWQLALLSPGEGGSNVSPLDNIGIQRNVRVESYSPESIIRFIAARESAEQAVTDLEHALQRLTRMEVDLSVFESVRQKQGVNGVLDLFSQRDMDVVERLSKTIVRPISDSTLVFYGMDERAVEMGQRTLLNMIDFPNKTEKSVFTDTDAEGFLQSYASETALHYRHRRKSYARWTMPTLRESLKTDRQKPLPEKHLAELFSSQETGLRSEEQAESLSEGVKGEEHAQLHSEDVASEEPVEHRSDDVTSEESTEHRSEDIASEEPTESSSEDVTSEEPTESSSEDVTSEEPVEPHSEDGTSEEAAESSSEDVTSEEPMQPRAEDVASEEPAEPHSEDVSSEESAESSSEAAMPDQSNANEPSLAQKITEFLVASPNDKAIPPSGYPENVRDATKTYWMPKGLIELYATAGNVLHKPPPSQSSLSPVSLPGLLDHSNNPQRIFLNTLPGFSPFMRHIASYAKRYETPNEEQGIDALVFRFVPSPWDLKDASNLEDFPEVSLRISLNRTTNRARFQGLGLTIRERFADVLLPKQPVDLRFTRREVLWSMAVLKRSKSVRDYLANLQTNLSGGGAIRAPPNMTLRIPSWTIRNSDRYTADLPMEQTEHETELTKDYVFLAVEHRQMMRYDMPNGVHRISYTSVEGGRVGGRRGEMRIRLRKPDSDLEHLKTLTPGLVDTALDVGHMIDGAVHGGLETARPKIGKVRVESATFKRMRPDGTFGYPRNIYEREYKQGEGEGAAEGRVVMRPEGQAGPVVEERRPDTKDSKRRRPTRAELEAEPGLNVGAN